MVVSYVLIELYFRPVVIMWKPFRRLFSLFREKWNLRTSIIDSFVTTFLPANIELQSVSFDLLTPVKVYHLYDTGNWTYSYRLFYDATVPYFGSRHLPYAIIAVAVAVLSTILPMLLFILYPFRCFQKFLTYSLFAGTSYAPLWTRSMEATKMGHSQGLVTVDGLLPSFSSLASA